jgi:hypothetical protein
MTRARTHRCLRTTVVKHVAVTALAVSVVAACSSGTPASSPAPDQSSGRTTTTVAIAGLETFDIASRKHTTDPVTYDQTPPVGGDHAPVWQNCGAYAAPIPTESGVHSMEHGAVWIVYRSDVDATTRVALEARAKNGPYVLVSPWATALPTKVVASAWGAQLKLDSADDPRLDAFLTRYREALTAPEPGAPCTGGSTTTR